MNKVIAINKSVLGSETFIDPVFEVEDDLLLNLFRYSYNEVESLFLNKLNKIRLITSGVEKMRLEEFEIIQDDLKDHEKELPTYLREDTGFKLGRLVHLHSYVHNIYLYYRIESDEIVLLQYIPSYETKLRLFDSNYFIELSTQWNEKISKYLNLPT